MMASASLTIGLIHLLIWVRRSAHYEYLAFFALTISVAGFAAGEWLLMRAESPHGYGEVLRWMQVAVFTGEISIAAFILFYLRAGRIWFFWVFCVCRSAALVLNFMYGANLNYLEVSALQSLSVWGSKVMVVSSGVTNPLEYFDEFINVLLVLFLADASVSAWRRNDGDSRRRAAIGGSFVLFFLVVAGQAALQHQGIVQFPYVVAVTFLGIVLVIACELGRGVLHAVQLSDQLRASEQRMDLAADAAGLGLWEWNVVRDELWATERGRALLGFKATEYISLEHFLERVHSEDRDGVREAVAAALSGGPSYEREYRVLLPDGRVRYISARGRVEKKETNAAPALMRGVVLDVTERREAEARAERLESEAVRQRNDLAHLARVAMLGELSSTLAHELNQPLAAILSNAQAAQRLIGRDPPREDLIRDILSDIVKNDKWAGEVIQRVRAFLRKEEPRHELLHMNELVNEVLSLMRGDLLSRKVDCTTNLASGLPAVSGDRIQLQQVVLNLVVNGCEAMKDDTGPRPLVVRTDVKENDGVRVSVIDRGSGIAAADLERVFEPFVTTKADGMGLGLAVCRTIVQSHGGRLWATNNAEGGATVQFGLPAVGS